MKQVTEKLNATNVQNQNANLDEASFGGRLGETASAVSKNIALKHMSKLGRKNHEDNIIYIHDLDHYEPGDHNCLTYPVDTSLENGVETRQTDIRKSGSVNTSMQLVTVFFQLQSLQQFRGVSASHLDLSMVPINPHSTKYRINDMFQDPRHSILKNLQRKFLFKFLPADLAHVAAQDRIIQEKLNLVSKHSNIMLRNEETYFTVISFVNHIYFRIFCIAENEKVFVH